MMHNKQSTTAKGIGRAERAKRLKYILSFLREREGDGEREGAGEERGKARERERGGIPL